MSFHSHTSTISPTDKDILKITIMFLSITLEEEQLIP